MPAERRVLLIGIGAGDPELITLQAITALNSADVFIIVDKAEDAADLRAARQAVLDRFCTARPHRVVAIADAKRDPSMPYGEAVREWHHRRTVAIEEALTGAVTDGETVGVLVWGDPSLYDSTIRIFDEINSRDVVRADYSVIAGISSVQALVASHRITLNRIGQPVLITTGRRLAEGIPDGVEDVVVMLDSGETFLRYRDQPYEIFWGAYLGSVDEVLVAGPIDQVADEIISVRRAAKARQGWIFDIYLMRRSATA